MSCEEDEGPASYQSFRNTQRYCKPVSTASTAAELIDDRETTPIDVSKYRTLVQLNSPIMTTDLKIKAVSLISEAKVDTLASIQSSIETRAKSWVLSGRVADSAGTKLPT